MPSKCLTSVHRTNLTENLVSTLKYFSNKLIITRWHYLVDCQVSSSFSSIIWSPKPFQSTFTVKRNNKTLESINRTYHRTTSLSHPVPSNRRRLRIALYRWNPFRFPIKLFWRCFQVTYICIVELAILWSLKTVIWTKNPTGNASWNFQVSFFFFQTDTESNRKMLRYLYCGKVDTLTMRDAIWILNMREYHQLIWFSTYFVGTLC